MNNIIAIRVEQKLVWDQVGEQYEATSWNIVFLTEGDTAWREIPVLTQYTGGPQHGLSQLSDSIKTGKEG